MYKCGRKGAETPCAI